MFNLRKTLLPVISLSIATIGNCTLSSQAQALIQFNQEYDFFTSASFIVEKNLLVGPAKGVTIGADFSLNLFESLVYANLADTNLAIQTGAPVIFDANPQTFGALEPQGGITFFGEGNDKLFGTHKGVNTINPVTLNVDILGDIVINGGEGRFIGASGSGTIAGKFTLGASQPGKMLVSLSFDTPKSIPENANSAGIVFAALCAGIMLKKALGVKQLNH
ncbi:hypothetical protein DSM106972_098760 [Dulcicalothrix desertica PCC 7102]|uniref:PEP-CTERM protein-sorting domain-containing protein n=1 Tax=Dulcicalothrix desertica PCC 7102 TaxID=232991 RepID=A0A433UFF5_9CYAN|nr:hypothetical protein [Dulcicalothrix desertica]RUS92543.1 hypothetical protein DSM106972_098760 [Dulcicalothrix desertica PCC 7102]TWH62690.1 hypothetical protein CAL7102_00199 [Dulcicalothrix desertica PCC 7102]